VWLIEARLEERAVERFGCRSRVGGLLEDVAAARQDELQVFFREVKQSAELRLLFLREEARGTQMQLLHDAAQQEKEFVHGDAI